MNLVSSFNHPTPQSRDLPHKSKNSQQLQSKISLVSAMETFVSAVNKMDSYVMIPCKLLDMSVPRCDETVPASLRSETDLHGVYQMLLSLRQELKGLSGSNSRDIMSVNVLQPRRKKSTTTKKSATKDSVVGKQMRTSITSSLTSLESVSSDTSECENDTDCDSGKSSDSDTCTDNSNMNSPRNSHSISLADTFRMHLSGLYSTLDELTTSANYISNRYQNEVCEW